MNFHRLSLSLRLPLAVFIVGLLVFPGGAFPRDDYFSSPEEVAVFLDERDDNNSFDDGLAVVIFDDALIQFSDPVSMGLGHGPSSAAIELRSTGPPNA